MPRAPLAPLDEAYDAAIRMLARKARSAAEVRAALLDKGYGSDEVESVLARLRAHRHLDDAELAGDQAFTLLEGKGLSPEAALESLVARGIDRLQAQAAIDEVREGRSELELCRAALERRLRGGVLRPEDEGREGRALSRLGWDEETVGWVLESALAGRKES